MSIEQKIEAVIALLRSPPTDSDIACGWTESAREDAAKSFEDVLTKLRNGVRGDYFGLVRALDFRGVFGGELLESVAKVANDINATWER